MMFPCQFKHASTKNTNNNEITINRYINMHGAKRLSIII